MKIPNPEVINPPKQKNYSFHLFGLVLLFLNKIRCTLRGYTNPRTFDITEYQKAIEYDFHVFDHWLKFLQVYTGNSPGIKGKTVLELGPGADLGIGLITLMEGAQRYNAIDANNLVESAPERFYDEFFQYIENKHRNKIAEIDFLRSQLERTLRGQNDKLNYIVNKEFDLSVFQKEKIDFVFSQAAFEHFDNVEKAISQLSRVCRSGTIMISEIDLKTHTRWIRDLDPLNIYRYNNFIYGLFSFPGSPNRLRPFEYQKILENHGWTKIEIIPLTIVENEYLTKIENHLAKKFQNPIIQMNYLTIILCATKE